MAVRREVHRSTSISSRGGKRLNRRHTWSSEDLNTDLSFEDDKIRALADEHESVQKKTFTNWVNVHLRCHGSGACDPVKNLYTDFQDGRLLFVLIENLSGNNLGKLSKGKLRIHNLENVEKCLNYLRRHEVQLENVHAHDVVDGNPKIVLGLVWKLILKYHLTDVRSHLQEGAGLVGGVKASLLLWCQRMTQGYEGVKVTNFTSSWKDGKAFAALLHRHRPDLLDYRHLLREPPLQILEAMFAVAEKALGVPRLIEPSDVASFPEEKSVMTYVGALFQTFSRMKLSNTVTVRLTKILKTLEHRDRLVRDFQEDAKRLLQWTSSRMNWLTNDRDVPTMEAKSCRTELKLMAGLWQKEKREKLLEWNQMILTCHTLCCTLQGMPARMGETLQSVQEAWLRLDAGENKRKSLLFKRISSAEQVNAQNHKIGKRVDRLLQKMHTLFQHADQVDSPASLNLAQEQLDRVITGLRRCTVFIDVAQQRCPHSDFTPYRERLSQLEVECGQIHAVLTHKAGFYSNQTVAKLMIQASALTDFLNEVKVSAASQNASLKLHSAHSSFQKERCRQFAIEVAAYLPHVKRVVKAMKQACPPASAHSPLRETLSEKAEGLLRAYNSLKRLGAEMAAAGKRREQRELQELREIEEREREELIKRREERKAVRAACDSAMEEILTSESEEEAAIAAEPSSLTNDIHDSNPAEDIHEGLPAPYVQDNSIQENVEVIDQFVDSEDASVVTSAGPDKRVLPIGEHLSDVQSSLPSSTSKSKLDQFRLETARESGSIPECTEEDDVGLPKANGRLPKSTEDSGFQKVESEAPSLAAGVGAQDKVHTDGLPLAPAPDEKLVSILAQVEAEWVSNCQSLLKELKKERKLLELSCDANDIGEKVFCLLQRLQFLVAEASVHLSRSAALQHQIHSCSQWQSSRGLQEVELVKEAILELSQSMNVEVAILLRLLDRQEGILKCEYALSWFSEKDYIISDLDPPAGSVDISYQIHHIRSILVEAELVFNSIESVQRAGPETNMANNAVESKTLLPAEKLLDVRQSFDTLSKRAQDRIVLLEETLRATSFSEWADIFSIWLAEKKNALSRYTMPSSVDMAQCFVVYFRRCHDSTLKACQAAVNEWEGHVAAMATDCPTFSRGVQHIFVTLKEDCDGYKEKLRQLEQSQNIQLQIRFHLFKIDGLVARLMNLIKVDTPSPILSLSEIDRQDAAINREMKTLESLVILARDKGKELIECTPPSEIGRKILTTEQDTLMSTWGQYHKGRLYLKQQLADMRVISDLCCEADRLIGRVGVMSAALLTPTNKGSKATVKLRLVCHCELGAELVSLAGEMGVCLHGALAVVGALGSGKVIVQEVFGRVSSMKEKWLPLPPLWEKTRDELVDAYQMTVAMAPIEDSEDWLSRMDDLLTSAPSDGEEGEGWEEEMRAVEEVEEELLQREGLFKLLQGQKQPTTSEEDEHFLTKSLLSSIPDLDFDAVLHLQEPRAPIAPDNSPPEETCTEAGVETGGAHVKGILKQSRFYRDQEVQVTMATERANGIHSQGLGAVNRKDNRAQVAEEECLVIVQTDREYTLDWAAVFGQSLFQDSPRPSPYPFWRSRSSSPTRTSPPVIERSHIHLERDKESDFFARVEALLRQPEQPEGDAKRQVSFHEEVHKFEYTPEASSEEESDEVSIDSCEDFHVVNSTFELGLSSHAVVEDPCAATDAQEAEEHSLEEMRKKRRREKVGSIWAWVNQRKGVADRNTPVEFVKAIPLLDPPVEWDTGREVPIDSSDPGEEEGNVLYNVSSLTSIIDRYEGKLMRKHEMESWSKRALKRSWKQFHAVAYLGQLSFYKDAKQALMGTRISRGFYLRGAKCEVAADYHKKPNVFRLTLANGAAYLFQANNETEVQEWVQNIQSQIQQESSTVGAGTRSKAPLPAPAAPTSATAKGSTGQWTVASGLV